MEKEQVQAARARVAKRQEERRELARIAAEDAELERMFARRQTVREVVIVERRPDITVAPTTRQRHGGVAAVVAAVLMVGVLVAVSFGQIGLAIGIEVILSAMWMVFWA